MSVSPCCLDGRDVDLLHHHHRLEGTLCLPATNRKRFGQRRRGDLPGEAPAVLAPPALAFHAAIADDRVPVTVRLFLILRRDLEGKGLVVPERATVETETGNAQDSELHRQHIALLAARIVTGSLVNSGYFTVRKGGGVEARRLMRVLVETEADRVFWFHVRDFQLSWMLVFSDLNGLRLRFATCLTSGNSFAGGFFLGVSVLQG